MFRFKFTMFTAVAVVFSGLFVSSVPSAKAGVIFSNLGPGDSYSSNQGWALIVNNGPFSNATQIGSSFVPSVNGTLESLQVAVSYPGTTNDQVYSFNLARDVGGRPGTAGEGALIESYTSAPFSTGASATNTLVNFTSTITPTLEGGTKYWIVFDGHTSSPSRTGLWRLNSTGAVGLSTLIGGSWNAYSNPSPAFRISGTSVPEPTSLGLVSIGGLGLLLLRRRTVPTPL